MLQLQWEDVNFAMGDYAPAIRVAVVLARERRKRLTQCSLCRKRRVEYGVLVPPALCRVCHLASRPGRMRAARSTAH